MQERRKGNFMDRGFAARYRQFVILICGIALLVVATLGNAASVNFGARTLEIPAPGQNKPVATSFPGVLEINSGYLPPANRLVDMYVTPDQVKEIGNAGHPALDHYFELQVPRTLEGIHIPAEQFAQGRPNIKAGLEKEFGKIQTDADGLARNGNQHLHEVTGNQSNVSMNSIGSIGIFREESWGVFFSMQSAVAITGHTPIPMIISGAIVWINGQVLYLYAVSQGTGKADIQWTQQSLNAWVNAIHAANPV